MITWVLKIKKIQFKFLSFFENFHEIIFVQKKVKIIFSIIEHCDMHRYLDVTSGKIGKGVFNGIFLIMFCNVSNMHGGGMPSKDFLSKIWRIFGSTWSVLAFSTDMWHIAGNSFQQCSTNLGKSKSADSLKNVNKQLFTILLHAKQAQVFFLFCL